MIGSPPGCLPKKNALSGFWPGGSSALPFRCFCFPCSRLVFSAGVTAFAPWPVPPPDERLIATPAAAAAARGRAGDGVISSCFLDAFIASIVLMMGEFYRGDTNSYVVLVDT